jgi:cytochrome P450
MTDQLTGVTAEARARAAGVPVVDFDPECDPRFKADPLGMIIAGREIGDVFYSTAARGFWVVTSAELYKEISQQAARFSARETFTHYRTPPPIFMKPPNLDPPEHGKVRKLITPFLSPHAVRGLEASARASVASIVAEVAEAGECDFMAEVALRVPAEVFLEQMGLPLSKWREIVALRLLPGKLNASNDPGGLQFKAAVDTVFGMFREVVAERRRRPADDIPSFLIAQSVDGKPLDDEEIVMLCYVLLGTSLGTTASTMAFLFQRLADDPELRRRATATPKAVGMLVEEAVRVFPAIAMLCRVVGEDMDFHGLDWREGDRILLLLAAANQDPTLFEAPEQFDPERSPNRHVGFGVGPHFCAGATLARMELQVLVEEWHRRITDYHVGDLSDLTYELSVAIRMTTLPLVIDATAPSDQ